MNTQNEALKMAIDLLETLKTGKENPTQSNIHIVCSICEEALAHPVQEPVGEYLGACWDGDLIQLYDDLKKGTKLYTRPAQEWQGLSDDEIMNIARESYMSRDGGDIKFARAIEQALKEKNHVS